MQHCAGTVQAEAEFEFPQNNIYKKRRSFASRQALLFVIDEVQTGMFRTGTFLASHSSNSDPTL